MEGRNRFLDSYKDKMKSGNNQHQEDLAFSRDKGFVKPEENAALIPEPSRKSRKWGSIIAASTVTIALIVGIILFINRGIAVIDLSGLTESEAQLWASDNGVNLQVEKKYNDEVEAGKVASQDKAEGSRIKKGDFIKIVISLGHDLSVRLPLPDFMSMTKSEIEEWIAKNYMAKVRITGEFSDEVPLGKVIKFEINDETVVDEITRNTPIYITISKGEPDGTVADIEIPDFKEMTIEEIYDFTNEHGLILVIEEDYDKYIPEGMIISQSVKPEKMVSRDTEITLVISKGEKIIVPNFSSHSKDKATTLAGELGIAVTLRERYSNAPADAFISQSIKAGEVYEPGDVLELTYSIDNKVILSSFVGEPRDAMETWVRELNNQGANIALNVTNTKSNSPKGTIIYQDKSNQAVGIKTTINITVSQGKVIFVPDFVAPAGSGYDTAITREKAMDMCEDLNIIPIFKQEVRKGRLPGEVWSQSIAAGKEVTEGTTITLKYTPINTKISVPNFNGMTRAQILAGKYNKNFDIKFEEGEEFIENRQGKVYKQTPHANAKVAIGSRVTVTIGPSSMGE